MLRPGPKTHTLALFAALALPTALTTALPAALTAGLLTGNAQAEPSSSSAVASTTVQRGRGGRKPRSNAGRPSAPRGIARPTAVDAIRKTGGAFGGPAAADDDRGGSAPLGGLNDVNNPVFGHPPERQQKLWFSIADGDSSEWISFREASKSMRFDAPRFCHFDKDNDGRMTFAEFSGYVISESAKNRRIIEPVLPDLDGGPRRRNAEQLRAAFDTDLDNAISRFEFETILRDYEQQAREFADNDVFARLDANGSKTLEVDELHRLASYLTPLGGTGASAPQPVLPGASTVLDLFGAVQDMGDAHPPRIAGPVPPFRRLDIDNDGFVDLADLDRLEGRSFNPIRLKSVLNMLDIDYDGRLSEAEFLASMAPPRR